MRFGAMIGWGIVIYAIMFLAWSGFVLRGFTVGLLPHLASLCILVVTSTIAARALRMHAWRDILPYSISWAVIVALFDALYSVPFTGWQLYLDWNVWLGYLLVVCVPLLAPYLRKRHEAPEIS